MTDHTKDTKPEATPQQAVGVDAIVMRCDGCKYWSRDGREHCEKGDHPDDKTGICKRYPPVRDMDWSYNSTSGQWIESSGDDWRAWQQPCTTGDCWCGEFVAA